MRRTGVGRCAAPRTWPIALAVGRVAEKRSSLDHALGCVGISWVPTLTRTSSVPTHIFAGKLCCYLSKGIDPIPIAAPLPDISSHVIEAVAIGRKRFHRRRSHESIFCIVRNRE